jgi:hypothetical protein
MPRESVPVEKREIQEHAHMLMLIIVQRNAVVYARLIRTAKLKQIPHILSYSLGAEDW